MIPETYQDGAATAAGVGVDVRYTVAVIILGYLGISVVWLDFSGV